MMVLGGVLFVVLVASAVAWGVYCDLRRDAIREGEWAKRKREQAILRLEVELGFRDPEEVRWQPRMDSHVAAMKEQYTMRSRIETRPQARAYQLSDREVAQLLLRHKRAQHG